MELIAGKTTIPVTAVNEGTIFVGDVEKPGIRLTFASVPNVQQVKALTGGQIVYTFDPEQDGIVFDGYTQVVSCELSLIRAGNEDKRVEALQQQLEAAERERQAAEQQRITLARAAAPVLSDDEAILYGDVWEPWEPGNFAVKGGICSYGGLPFRIVEPHDSSEEPAWNPADKAEYFRPLHGSAWDTALPYIAPTGEHDRYLFLQTAIWEGGIMRCIAEDGTMQSPADAPDAWEEVVVSE